MPRPPVQLLIALLVVLPVLGTGCGHRAAATPRFVPLTTRNDAGIRLEVLGQKERDSRLVLTIRLVNDGTRLVQIHNPAAGRVAGFALTADNHPAQGADAGSYAARSQAAQIEVLPPGTESQFDISWTFDPRLAHDTLPMAAHRRQSRPGRPRRGRP